MELRVLGPRTIRWIIDTLRRHDRALAQGARERRPTPQKPTQRMLLALASDAMSAGDTGTFKVLVGKPSEVAYGGQDIDAFCLVQYLHQFEPVLLVDFGMGWYAISLFQQGLLGKTTEDIAIDTAGTVELFYGDEGAETSTGVFIQAFNKFGAVVSGKWVWVSSNGSALYLTARRC